MAIVLNITTIDGKTIEMPLLSKCSLGRSSKCDLVIEDKEMSGSHGIFELTPHGQVVYTDLGSTNGSYLNNSKIHKIIFKQNESLRLGNTIIVIDEKKLNIRERADIGKGNSEEGKNTLLIPSAKNSTTKINNEKDTEDIKKKYVTLNKDLKKKVPKSNWMAVNKDNLIDQEKSTGNTKMLKLDKNKPKKK